MESVADKLNQRLGYLAGLRAGHNFLIWSKERELLEWFVRYVHRTTDSDDIREVAGELVGYFDKYERAE